MSCFTQKNLVSDVVGMAPLIDPKLVDPWGVVVTTDGIWVAARGSKSLIRYVNAKVTYPSLVVTTTGSPTGLVEFVATIVTVTQEGTIEAYIPTTSLVATVVKVGPAAANVYTGATVSGSLLYVANFSQGSIDVYTPEYTIIASMSIIDLGLRTIGYNPYNVYSSNCSERMYVTYALRDVTTNKAVSGVGNGYLSLFEGGVLTRLVNRGPLNSPWGMLRVDGGIYVGNVDEGLINSFRLTHSRSRKYILDYNGYVTTKGGGNLINDGIRSIVVKEEIQATRATQAKQDTDCGCDSESVIISAGIFQGTHGLLAKLRE